MDGRSFIVTAMSFITYTKTFSTVIETKFFTNCQYYHMFYQTLKTPKDLVQTILTK